MFESALIRRHVEGERLVDAGTIAETLLFYEHVHILCDRGILSDLLRVIGPENLLRLLQSKQASLTYLRQNLGVLTNTDPTGIQFHNFATFQIGAKTKRLMRKFEEIDQIVERTLGKSKNNKAITKSLMDHVIFRDLDNSSALPADLPALAREDLHDANFLKKAIRHTITTLIPNLELSDDFEFNVIFSGNGDFVIGTNLNFVNINKIYHTIYPPEHSSLTPAYLLSFILNARSDAYFAADYMSEIVTTPVASGIINLKLGELLLRRNSNLSQLQMFQQHLLEDTRCLREAINAGERSFGEFLDLLSRAGRFKHWLRDRNPDADLLQEYYKSAISETWIEKRPTKSLRFVLATLGGLGADMLFPTGGLGTALGVGVGAADSLVLDRIVKGWRPNHFIEGDLRRFTSEPR